MGEHVAQIFFSKNRNKWVALSVLCTWHDGLTNFRWIRVDVRGSCLDILYQNKIKSHKKIFVGLHAAGSRVCEKCYTSSVTFHWKPSVCKLSFYTHFYNLYR
jgi:hypothetical protein